MGMEYVGVDSSQKKGRFPSGWLEVTKTTIENKIEKIEYNLQNNNTVNQLKSGEKDVFLNYIVIRGILKSIIETRIQILFVFLWL